MFDFVQENKRMVQGILFILILPFAVWGVSSYRNSGADVVVSVEGENITMQEFNQAMENAKSQMSARMGSSFDPALFDRPEAKLEVLRMLVDEKLQVIKAREAGLAPSNEMLVKKIAAISIFQTNGKFDSKLYAAWLDSHHTTASQTQAQLRDQIAAQRYADMYRSNGDASRTAADNIIRASQQQRIMRVATISPAAFLKKVKVADADAKKYYDAHQQEFSIPERARVEYVTFSARSAMNLVSVSPDDVQAYYHDHQSEYTTPEQRRAAHILIPLPPGADAAAIQKSKEQAEAVLKQVRQSPGKFAELAKKYSKDPGSAAKGGDLGFFESGQMVKPFDDAVFSLKPGQISGLVQSQYGFHIIKLLAIHPAKTHSLDEVKNNIIEKLKAEKAGDMFAKMEDAFSDASVSQTKEHSLKKAADLVKSTVQQSGWLEKGNPGAAPWTDKALTVVFSDDVLHKGRNSPAVEVAPDTLLVVRLLQHEPATTRPFADVRADIMKRLAKQKASALAAKQGQDDLALRQQGKGVSLKWGKNEAISIAMGNPPSGVERGLYLRALQADISKLPAYVGMESAEGGYTFARIDSVKDQAEVNESDRALYLKIMRQSTGEELLQATLADARKHAKISTKNLSEAGKQL